VDRQNGYLFYLQQLWLYALVYEVNHYSVIWGSKEKFEYFGETSAA
jgi:hypothetical protein